MHIGKSCKGVLTKRIFEGKVALKYVIQIMKMIQLIARDQFNVNIKTQLTLTIANTLDILS